MITTVFALTLGLAADPAPVMRVRAADLDLSSSTDAAVFAGRVAEQSRAFCAVHVARITPEHANDPRWCERGMALEVVRALPHHRRAQFLKVGGRRMLSVRLQRQFR